MAETDASQKLQIKTSGMGLRVFRLQIPRNLQNHSNDVSGTLPRASPVTLNPPHHRVSSKRADSLTYWALAITTSLVSKNIVKNRFLVCLEIKFINHHMSNSIGFSVHRILVHPECLVFHPLYHRLVHLSIIALTPVVGLQIVFLFHFFSLFFLFIPFNLFFSCSSYTRSDCCSPPYRWLDSFLGGGAVPS